MKIEIDQSGKIEHTNKLSILAFYNNTCKAIAISANEKKKLQRYFRENNQPRMFSILVFSVMVYLLIRGHISNNTVYIDREYPGYENFIKEKIIFLFHKYSRRKIDKGQLHFTQIGKKSRAHIIAYQAYREKKYHTKIGASDIKKVLTKKSGNA